MAATGDRRRKERQRRAAARRLPPVRGKGRRLPTGGRARPVRMVGVGQFADGLARRRTRPAHVSALRRLGGIVAGVLVAVIAVLWIIARLAGHL